MGRPCLKRRVNFNPQSTYFKPQGIPASVLDIIDLEKEELEAMRLKNLKGYDQAQCARAMNTSPTTLQRLLSSAYRKVSKALVEGKAIRITGE